MKKASVLDYLQLRVLSCYTEALMLKENKMPPPRMAIIYPTYLCNHRCLGCDYTKLNKTKDSLKEREFIDIINQLIDIGIKGIEFCGGGEPTLHPSLPRIIDMLIEHKISFGFLTNGTNLTSELQSKLVKSGSYCRVSLESASEQTFNFYKRPISDNGSFKKVVRNLQSLVKLRNQNSSRTRLQVSLKYAVDSNNYLDACKAIGLADRLKLDSVQYKLIRNMPSELRDTQFIDALKRQIIETADKYHNLKVIVDFEKTRLKGKCWLSPLQLVIDPRGDVYICCYYRHRMKEHRLGNMLKNNLRDIWYSKEHRRKIANIKRADCNKYGCRFHYYNELMQELIVDDVGQLSFI